MESIDKNSEKNDINSDNIDDIQDIKDFLKKEIQDIDLNDITNIEHKINGLIERKIYNEEMDAQALPILKKINNEIKSAKFNWNNYLILAKKEYEIEKEAENFAKNVVNTSRQEREASIKQKHKQRIKAQKEFEDEEEARNNKNKQEIRNLKRKRKQYKAEQKIQRREAKLRKQQNKFEKKRIAQQQEKFKAIANYENEKQKIAHRNEALQKELKQQEHEATMKRAQKNAEMEASFDHQKKEWAIKQEKMEKTWKNEDKAMTADYAARIAKSERAMAEDLKATHDARNKAFKEEKLHSEKLKEALNVAKKIGKSKAQLENINKIHESIENVDIEEFYEKSKNSWDKNSISDVEKTIKELEAIKMKTNNEVQVELINKKLRTARATLTKRKNKKNNSSSNEQ